MEVITFQSEAYKDLRSELENLKSLLVKNNKINLIAENWYDVSEACFALKCSKRKLQTLRDTQKLKFSKIDGKIYFKVSDIQELLEANYL